MIHAHPPGHTRPTTTLSPSPHNAAAPPDDPERTGRSRLRAVTRRYPVSAFLVMLLGPVLTVSSVVILTGAPFGIAEASILVFLVLAPIVVTRAIGGDRSLRRLYAGLARWRIGLPRWLFVLAAIPAVGLGLALVSGTLVQPGHGWPRVVLTYLAILVAGALTGNLWEETAWAGFVQSRLMDRHGLFAGSMLTAVPFAVIHLPLAFQNGLSDTTVRNVLITWGFLIALAPFMRYLIGMLLDDTGGSTLAAGCIHASFNATMALTIFHGSWQALVALVVLTVAMAGWRSRRRLPRSSTR